jgi:hypothetical protein
VEVKLQKKNRTHDTLLKRRVVDGGWLMLAMTEDSGTTTMVAMGTV